MRFNRNISFFDNLKDKIVDGAQRVIRYYWLKKLERIRERRRIAAEKAARYPKSKVKEYREGAAKVSTTGKGYTKSGSNKNMQRKTSKNSAT